jgi:hypothetical protein
VFFRVWPEKDGNDLISTKPGEQRRLAGNILKPAGRGGEHGVTSMKAVAIVHLFEAHDVTQQQGHGRL